MEGKKPLDISEIFMKNSNEEVNKTSYGDPEWQKSSINTSFESYKIIKRLCSTVGKFGMCPRNF